MKKAFWALICLLISSSAFSQKKSKYELQLDSMLQLNQDSVIIPYFKKELKADPKNEELLKTLGLIYLSLDSLYQGTFYYATALSINPACSPCYLNLARYHASKGNMQRAFELIENARTAAPTDADIYLYRSLMKDAKGDKVGAELDMNTAVKMNPNNIEYLVTRAELNAKNGYTATAMSDLNKAEELDNQNTHILYKKSEIYYKQNRFDESLIYINKCLALDSSNTTFLAGRGAIYSKLADHEKSIADYTTLIALDSTNFQSYKDRAYEKYQLEDMDGSCEDARKANQLLHSAPSPDSLKLGMAEQLEDYCDPNKVSYYYQRGIALYNLNQFEKALEIYDAGLKIFPNHCMLLSFKANAEFELKRYKMAITHYKESIANRANLKDELIKNTKTHQAPTDLKNYEQTFISSMQISIAQAKFALNLYQEALQEINIGITTANENDALGKEKYYNARGNIYLGLKQFKEALKDFEYCIKFNPTYSIAYVNRAIALMNMTQDMMMKSKSITGGINDKLLQTFWDIPYKTNFQKNENNIIEAIKACDMAIALDSNLASGYYIRGVIKKAVTQNDYCIDIIKAAELGYPVEKKYLSDCKR